MGVGKGSQEKTGVKFCETSSSLPGTELLNLVLLICNLWGFDWFCLKDKCLAAPKESSLQTFQNLWCLLVLLQWCSKWRRISLHNGESLLKLCAVYWSSQVNYSHDSISKNCDLAFGIFTHVLLSDFAHPYISTILCFTYASDSLVIAG